MWNGIPYKLGYDHRGQCGSAEYIFQSPAVVGPQWTQHHKETLSGHIPVNHSGLGLMRNHGCSNICKTLVDKANI